MGLRRRSEPLTGALDLLEEFDEQTHEERTDRDAREPRIRRDYDNALHDITELGDLGFLRVS